MAKKIKTYAATFNGETKTARSSRDIKWGSIGVFSDGHWFLTLSAQADPMKAARAAKGTNPYISEYHAVPVTIVED